MSDSRLYYRVANQIEAMIDEGGFPPGSRLPGERELAEMFDVSRVTIREAEISLQAVGRIEIKTGSGVYVCEPKPSSDLEGLCDLTAFELTEARCLYEGESAALAAPMISDENLGRLQALLDKMAQKDIPKEDVDQADREFHMVIAQSTGNAAIVFVINRLWKMRDDIADVKKVYDAVCKEDPEDRVGEHLEILEALRSRDSEAARKAMRGHFSRLLDTMLHTTEKEAVEEVRRKASASRERFSLAATLG